MDTLAVPVVPAGGAFGATALATSAQVRFRGRGQTDLTAAIFNARAELFVPPTGVRREDGHTIGFTQTAAIMVEIPADLIADSQAAAGALQGQITGKPPIAEPASLRIMPLVCCDTGGREQRERGSECNPGRGGPFAHKPQQRASKTGTQGERDGRPPRFDSREKEARQEKNKKPDRNCNQHCDDHRRKCSSKLNEQQQDAAEHKYGPQGQLHWAPERNSTEWR